MLMRSLNPYNYFLALEVHDPDYNLQLDFLNTFNMFRYKLSQVEIAFDFYPEDINHLDNLQTILDDGAVLKYSRPNNYNRYKSTSYRGKHGNVRFGSKGIRLYHKPERSFVRMEIVLNRQYIRKRIHLPINLDQIHLADYIVYRNDLCLDKLASYFMKKVNKSVPCSSVLKEQITCLGILKRQLLSLLHANLNPYQFFDGSGVHVSDQISQFKLHFKESKLRKRTDYFFPVQPDKLQDIGNGFVRTATDECLVC
jgi:hypothetical protein